jgi:outer membrane beta-barrel protein
MYGKFALFNKWIFQWETYIQAGIGVMQTDWIPRDPANASATNYDVLWHVDIGTRLFLTKWLAIHAYLKDYMFVDKFEPPSRMNPKAIPDGVSEFVQNIVFGVGVGMFLPTGFEYKYTR